MSEKIKTTSEEGCEGCPLYDTYRVCFFKDHLIEYRATCPCQTCLVKIKCSTTCDVRANARDNALTDLRKRGKWNE